MSARRMLAGAVGLALLVVVVAAVVILVAGGDDTEDDDDNTDPTTSSSTALPVVADETWCEGWENLVALQAQYVASPTPEAGAQLLSVVDDLQALGVPESLDPAGYTELTAVLDDIHASVDSSFTPSAVPSEPGDPEADPAGAPFGAWLAEYCAI